jgi:hypothetical protein
MFIVVSKLINAAVPKTIDERAINLNLSKQDIFRQTENLQLGKLTLFFLFSLNYVFIFSD